MFFNSLGIAEYKIKLYICISFKNKYKQLKITDMKAQKYYLVEDFGFMKGNVFCGSEKECETELLKLISNGADKSKYFISINRWE